MPAVGNKREHHYVGHPRNTREVYHVTSPEIAERIEKEGIKKGKNDYVYLAPDRRTADEYEQDRLRTGRGSAVVTVSVPENAKGIRMHDLGPGIGSELTSERDIPVKWISKIERHD